MFDTVVDEIEERQEHLVALGNSVSKQAQTRMKNEICERIAELQKIRELQNKAL